MSRLVPVKHNGSIYLPVGEISIQEIDARLHSRWAVYVQFYNANREPTTPTRGTVRVLAALFDDQWLTGVNSDITATEVIAHPTNVATYTPPSFYGAISKIQIRPVDILGVSLMRAQIWGERE